MVQERSLKVMASTMRRMKSQMNVSIAVRRQITSLAKVVVKICATTACPQLRVRALGYQTRKQ